MTNSIKTTNILNKRIERKAQLLLNSKGTNGIITIQGIEVGIFILKSLEDNLLKVQVLEYPKDSCRLTH